MKARLLFSYVAVAAALTIGSCSSGLGNNLPTSPPPPAPSASTNLPVGLELGVELTDPAQGAVVTGVVVPPIGTFTEERDVVLVAFSTADPGGDGVSTTGALSRDLVGDANGAADVFVAAVCAQDVNPNAFSQSLAGKFRHPRCVTCHSMTSATTTAFGGSVLVNGVPQTPPGFTPHAGPLPGTNFPANDPSQCVACHLNSTEVPVQDWKAPDSTFDLRTETIAELAARATIPPTGDADHFTNDPRVLWALDSGITPVVGNGNGAADDDHDGVIEASDKDGTPRPVPGGSAVFLQQIEEWKQDGSPLTAGEAVCDVTLVSRAVGGTNAGDGASTKPQVVYVPEPTIAAPGKIGTLYVVYQSDATDLVAGDGNGATDVFRVAVDLVADANGDLDLQVNSDATLVSAIDGTTNVGDAAATNPVLGGAAGELVAFESLASDLIAGFTDGNGPTAADVYLRDLGTNDTSLVSHRQDDQSIGGDGASEAPSIDPAGRGVAFESDATDLTAGADTNAVRDVFYSAVGGGAPFVKVRASVSETGAQGTGGASGDASVHVSGGGRALVAFESAKTDLAPTLVAANNVFLFDSDSGATTLLNQLTSSTDAPIGDGDARNPAIDGAGATVAFESAATNIDVLRPDGNGAVDVFLVDVGQALAGDVLPYRYSLTTREATDGNGDSTEPQFAAFASASSTYGVGFSVFRTAATNLGNSDSTDLIVTFLDETSGAVADFSADVTSGAAPLTVQFTDQSSGAPTSWAWDFDDDGNVDSTEQSPSYTYETAGVYTVALTATNAVSSNTATRTDLVTVFGPPVVDFSVSASIGTTATNFQFTDASSTAPELVPDTWAWDFDNDGNVDSTQQNPQFAYATPGTYTVTLTASNAAGSVTETKQNLVEVLAPVVAGFTPSTPNGVPSFDVTFTNTSTGADSYVWDFGDGSPTVTTVSPTHTFTSSGTFTVTLTATNAADSDTETTTITSFGSVSASFTITVPGGNPANAAYTDESITLDASGSTGTITTYEWDFDNDNFATVEATGVNPAAISVGATFPSTTQTDYVIRLRVTGPGPVQSVFSVTFRAVAASETLAVNAIHDTTIFSNAVNNSNGADTALVIGKTWTQGYRRSVLRFDVSAIPSNATVNVATVRFRDISPSGTSGGSHPGGVGSSQLTGPQTFEFRRLTTAWIEGDADGLSGIGTTSNVNGGATFASPWTTSGGDFLASSATVFVDNVPNDFVTSSSVVADVQAWVDGTANNGWLLKSALETGTSSQASIKWLASSEASTTSHRPLLDVDYTRALASPPQ